MPNKRNVIVVSGLAVVLASASRPAEACQICTAVGVYNMFPFGVVWFYLLLVWIAFAFVADVRGGASEDDSQPRLLHAKSGLMLGVAVLVLSLAGMHFVALLFFPLVLAPYCLGDRLLASPLSRLRAQLAPGWLRWAGRGTALGLALSLIPAYSLFPAMTAELQTRAMIARVKTDLRQTAAVLAAYEEERHGYPTPVEESHDGAARSLLNLDELRPIVPHRTDAELLALARDPFVIRRRTVPRLMSLAIFFPISIGGGSWETAEGYPKKFGRIRYLRSESGFVLWSRGPDGEFSEGLPEWLAPAQSGDAAAAAALADMSYDPTNGTISSGDIFLVGPAGGFGWPGSRW